MIKVLGTMALAILAASVLSATQFSYTNSGGSVSQTTSLSMTAVVLASPAGTVSMSCPLTSSTPMYPYYSQWTCSGGSLTIQSTDGTTSVSGTFTSGTFNLQKVVSGNVTNYDYSFFANFAGSQIVNGASSAVLGSVSETLAALNSYLGTGTIQTGLINVKQQYEPIYIADTGNNRIVHASDVLGSNWSSLGKLGSGVKQFSAPWGVALDSAGKIYVSDTGNCRIVRMDNILGLNWTSYGVCGSGAGQFSNAQGLWVDSSERIYVADSGNNRVVRMDDITGTGWVSLGTLGNGTNQFNTPSAVTTDAAGNIYVADTINARIVEMADMTGANWAVLQLNLLYFPFYTSGVAVDSAGRIYTTDSDQSQFYRVDNISGVNPIDLYINYNNYADDPHIPTGVFADPDNAIYLADTGNNRIERYFDMSFNDVDLLGTLGSGTGNLNQPHSVVAMQELKPVPVPAVTPASLTFPTELVGSASPVEIAVLTNIGTAPMTVSGVSSTSTDFSVTHNCPSTLAAGQSCSASVIFKPMTGGLRKASLTFSLLGAPSKSIQVSGSGALVTVSPSQLILYFCASGKVTVTNPLSTSTTLKSFKTSRGFTETNNCGTLTSGASCTVTINWCSSTPITGVLTVTDAAGTPQYVTITGEQ